MNKSFVPFLLLLSFTAIIMYGCGQSGSSSSSGTLATSDLATVKSAALMAGGSASAGVSATTVGGSASTSPKTSSIRSTWMHAMLGTPPPAFFTYDMTTSTDGYFAPGGTALGGNMQPYIRLRTVGGDIVGGNYFTTTEGGVKKIADLSPCSVEAVFAGSPTQAPVGIVTGMNNFVTNYQANPTTAFTSIKYMGDYLCWAYIYPTMEANAPHPLPSGAHLTTPIAAANDKIAALENKMVFSNIASGEITMSLPTHPDGRVKAGTYTGSGKITTAVATMDVTNNLIFNKAGEPPSSVTITATNESAPKYTVVITVSDPSTGTGTGKIYDETGAEIGSLKTTAGGGSATIDATTETFTF